MAKFTQFLKEVRSELSKVSWPTRSEIVRYTAIVIALTLAIAVFLGLLDFLFEWILNKFIIR